MQTRSISTWLLKRRKQFAISLGAMLVVAAVMHLAPDSVRGGVSSAGKKDNRSDVEKIPTSKVLGLEEVDRLALEKLGPPPAAISAEMIAEAQRRVASTKPQLERVRQLQVIQSEKGHNAVVASLKADAHDVESKK